MFCEILHVGLTVSDLERSIGFYRDVLGLQYVGRITMEGPETDALFGRSGCKAEVGYLNGKENLQGPPVELIQFVSHTPEKKQGDLFTTSISELCFRVKNLQQEYERLLALGVEFLSAPQEFDFTADGFGRSRAVYLRDPDGIILELMEPLP